jgi:hypothetical protein
MSIKKRRKRGEGKEGREERNERRDKKEEDRKFFLSQKKSFAKRLLLRGGTDDVWGGKYGFFLWKRLEILDFGYPQNTETDTLKMYITTEGVKSEKIMVRLSLFPSLPLPSPLLFSPLLSPLIAPAMGAKKTKKKS